jgi:isopentenyl-diphosphate delta-isomerase
MGGTSFSAVEMHRARKAQDRVRERIGETFFDWGIPSPVSLRMAQVGLPLIASGGIGDGLQAAKALVMGASLAGTANPILKEAMVSADAVEGKLVEMAEELRVAMMLTGSRDLEELANQDYIVTGPTREWMQRDHK